MPTFNPEATPAFHSVPWLWRDLLIGIASLVLVIVSVKRLNSVSASRWIWVPTTLLTMAWMLVYPIWIVRSRVGLPARPRFGRLLVEGPLALIAVLGSFVIMYGMSLLLVQVFGEAGAANTPFEQIAGSSNPFDPVALAVLAVLIAPLTEEAFFRGMLYNALRQWMPPILAALLQAVAFGLYHPFGLAGQAVIAVPGFFMALLYEWRKTLLAPILFHAMMNSIGMVFLLWTVGASANAPVLGIRGEGHDGGCLVTEVVPGGSAADAGLRVGDVITAAAEYSVSDLRDVVLIMRMKKVGDRIPVYYRRAGENLIVEVTLRARPNKS